METKPSEIKIEKFDELFQYIGGLGTYQIVHLFIMCTYLSIYSSVLNKTRINNLLLIFHIYENSLCLGVF